MLGGRKVTLYYSSVCASRTFRQNVRKKKFQNETGVNCPNHRQTSLTARVRPRDVMKFTRSVIPYIYCNLQHIQRTRPRRKTVFFKTSLRVICNSRLSVYFEWALEIAS